MQMANNLILGRPLSFNTRLLEQRNNNYINLTLKNYNMRRGLSTRIHGTKFDEEAAAKKLSAEA